MLFRAPVALADLPVAFLVAVAVALGLALGSFANVLIYRLPRGLSVVSPGSRCPRCERPIRAWQNVPVFGWLLLRGRAACCGARISPRYPLVEALGGLLGAAVMLRVILPDYGDAPAWVGGVTCFLYLLLGIALLAAFFIDLEHMLLPDVLTLGGVALGLLSVPLRPQATLLGALIGAAAGALIVWFPFIFLYEKLKGHAGMGLGDAKLLALAGAWFGWQGAVFALFAGALQATLVIATVLIVRRGKLGEPEAVTREREELQEAIAAATGAERLRLEAELASDPALRELGPGVGKLRIAFGPFLVLAILEYMLLGEGQLWQACFDVLYG